MCFGDGFQDVHYGKSLFKKMQVEGRLLSCNVAIAKLKCLSLKISHRVLSILVVSAYQLELYKHLRTYHGYKTAQEQAHHYTAV